MPCRMRTRDISTSIASSMKCCTALRASSPRMPRTSRSWRKLSLCESIVCRVSRLMANVASCVDSGFLTVCSSRDVFTFVLTSPNTTVASLPCTDSTVPTVVRPHIRTVSPTANVCCSALAVGVGSLVPIVVGLPAFSFLSFLRFSRRSLRSIIWRIFFSIRSSADLVSISLTSSLKAFSSSRRRFVSSFSA